ncbi:MULTISPECIES: RNA polymerase sigma factor [unclassified Ruminococcus]|uniref:RNA polymerase sigma factor n=1 Tax=unclassified Ruminococcus TaxID=2608920 RepID=UPI00210B571A|nr:MULTISPECIES: RNA polymerase sigma factor [unclassified Ruminococcus]MCQ4022890.1 hypothetical protein [Ruminococcus sp. zg-924]MCQ4115294.1 hypothetical protein [Ruminococcus sp. zg-921]
MIANSTQLVQAAQRGDTKAVSSLYKQSFKSAYLTAKSIVQNQADADSLVKESYLQAFYNINTIPDVSAFDKWFNTIVDKKAKEYLLKTNSNIFPQSISSAASSWSDESAPKLSVTPNLATAAMNTIYALPANQKLILIMYYNQGLNTAEIADTLSISVDEVKGTLYNARQAIEQDLSVITPPNIPVSSVIYSSFVQASNTCIAPKEQVKDIINTLTGGSVAVPPVAPNPTPVQNPTPAQPNMQSVQPNIQHDTVNNGMSPDAAAVKSGISKGAKLALIIGGAAALVIAVIVIILVIMFSNQKNGEVIATQPTAIAETLPEEETEAETQAQEDSNVSSNEIFDSSYALPSDYELNLASFDKKNGFDSGLGLDEVDTIKEFEKLPEIKDIVDDKDSYVSYNVEQNNIFLTRRIFNSYIDDGVSYSVFISTDEKGNKAPTSLSMIFNSLSDDVDLSVLRSTAKKLLELTKLDSTAIDALLYSDREDSDSITASNDLGSYYLLNEIDEDELNISIYFYPEYSSDTPEGIKPKYFEDDFSKYYDLNKVFNNSDVDFNDDLSKQGLSKLSSVDYAKKISNENYYPTVSYTKDQNGKLKEVSLYASDSFTFDSDNAKLDSADVTVSYLDSTLTGTTGDITLKYSYTSFDKSILSDCAKLAAEQLKFFDKDISVSEKDLTLSNSDDSKDLDVKTKLSKDGKAELEILDDGESISYTLSWDSEDSED